MAILIFETKILDQYHHLTRGCLNYNFSFGSILSPQRVHSCAVILKWPYLRVLWSDYEIRLLKFDMFNRYKNNISKLVLVFFLASKSLI